MQLRRSITIQAPISTTWERLVDIESWPGVSESIESVELVDSGPLQVGSRARVQQPKMPLMTWKVTELEPNASFVWSSKVAGVTTVAAHTITEVGGATQMVLTIDQYGALAWLFARISAGRSRRYLELEAQAHKRSAEQAAGTTAA
ncbi:MAG: SRPBCC family protein [Nocardioidaceae bacterium]